MIHANHARSVSQELNKQKTVTAICGRRRALGRVVNAAAIDKVTCTDCLDRLEKHYDVLAATAEGFPETEEAADLYHRRAHAIRRRLVMLNTLRGKARA